MGVHGGFTQRQRLYSDGDSSFKTVTHALGQKVKNSTGLTTCSLIQTLLSSQSRSKTTPASKPKKPKKQDFGSSHKSIVS